MLITRDVLAHPRPVSTLTRNTSRHHSTPSQRRDVGLPGSIIMSPAPLRRFQEHLPPSGRHHIPFSTETAFVTPAQQRGAVHPANIRTLDAFTRTHNLELLAPSNFSAVTPVPIIAPIRTWIRHTTDAISPRTCSFRSFARLTPRAWSPTGLTRDRGSGLGHRRTTSAPIGGRPLWSCRLLIGRCIIASMPTLESDPGFHSSAFVFVPKKDAPLTVDGRIIQDLSSPAGSSVSDLTDSTVSPDGDVGPTAVHCGQTAASPS